MIKNIFRIVVRNLWRYKGYTIINIAGLGLGLAAMVWAFQNYRFSTSFDSFHPDQDNVYRVVTKKDGADALQGIFPAAAVQAAKNEFPGIEAAVRFDGDGLNIKRDEEETFAEQAQFTDPDFFKLFNFPLVAGNNDISDRSAVIISETAAKKYFGKENPLGKTLLFYAGRPYAKPLTVKGVLKDAPLNSTIQFHFITNFENLTKPDGTGVVSDDWKWFLDGAFFKIPNPADAKQLADKLKKYLPLQNKAREDWKASGFQLYSLRENAKLSHVLDANAFFQRPEDSATYGPIVLAFLLLLSACLNFSNTTVARANQKLKEIGMRKVMGGSQRQLIIQLLMECAFIVLLAVLLSALINMWWLPAFNKMFVWTDVHANYLQDSTLLLFLFIILLFTTLLAGAYPAFYITRFNPSVIFRGSVKFGGRNIFSRIMLGLQVAIAIITAVAGIAFSRNATFQKNYDFGYNVENTISVAVTSKNDYNTLKNELGGIPQVTAMAGTRYQVGFDYRNKVVEAENFKKEVHYLEVGNDYTNVMGLKMAAGRSFDKEKETDYSSAVLITQKMAALYGWKDEEALNKIVKMDTASYSVIGVLKDFHSDLLFSPLEPVAMKLVKEDQYQYLVVQAKQGDLTNVYEQTKKAWQKLFPLQPFRGLYQNEVKSEGYRVSNNIATIFSWFAVVSVLLTATGLFALVSLTVLKKMKEIAIRKVAGAYPKHILVLIGKGYFWIFVLSAFFGACAGYALTQLLLDMIFKTNNGIGGYTLFYAIAILFTIAFITTGIKVWQAVKTNPVKMLRTE